MDAISKLVHHNLMKERPAPNDKRAKLIQLTEAGKSKLAQCYARQRMVNQMMLSDVPLEIVQLCTRLLSPIEEKHARLAIDLKNKTLEEMYVVLTGAHQGPR
ncbi:hypothetical protein GCM10028803_45690 [Larkinella knui]|uniref:HTH marR-type domain-containing protein n=1 Tax=Larkinella knui TaxID=2025310 RepID=A0A3P1CPJ1_9BACT|nr:hypothetical protein [Larkinella knui]RRB15169.1 hypothetical protein EHT87_11530 [Larkinella knui]